MTATPRFEQSFLISIPVGWDGLLLTILHKAERQAVLDQARLAQMGADPAANIHTATKALRELVEQQLRGQRRIDPQG